MKNSSGNKTGSKDYRLVINSFNFVKVLDYLLLSHFEKNLPVHQNKFACQPATVCIDTITVLKEIVMY